MAAADNGVNRHGFMYQGYLARGYGYGAWDVVYRAYIVVYSVYFGLGAG